MRVKIIGGGPGGLYSAILLRTTFPDAVIEVFERNRHDDTFGFGVVFSDETMDQFREADAPTSEAIAASFRHWNDIEIYYRGTCTISTGHGFAALSRRRLLLILQDRAREVGVDLHFEREVDGVDQLADADLVIAADGVNSQVRAEHAEVFRPHLDWRQCRFCWLGTDRPMDAFTFIFEETPFGLFQVHAYPFEDGLATWIVECQEDVWLRAGLEQASEETTVAFCREHFGDFLGDHRLLTNRSHWRVFPTVQCETWHSGNLVLLGDAAHTAHFSVGSGTKLAMDGAIALREAFERHGWDDIPATLQAYEDARWVDVVKLQRAAQTSLEWFENSARYMGQSPLQLTFNLMTRSKRITYDNLQERDPDLVARLDRSYQDDQGVESADDPPPPIFTPFRLRGMELANRIVVSPMCQYSAIDGTPNDWHLVHLGSRAIGGAGLIVTEMTDVSADARISAGCTGLYHDDHTRAWRRIVDFVHTQSDAKIAIQLAHAGRKGSSRHPWEGDDEPLGDHEGAWETVGPSALPFRPHWPAPRSLSRSDMDRVRDDFVAATHRSDEAGFDMIELHMAHGYLLSSFISSLSNQREDEYGGPLENRLRFPLEVFAAVRAAWPVLKPITVRVTATDWMDDGSGMTPDEAVETAQTLKAAGCDAIDVSSGGNSPDSQPDYGRMYQVPFAEKIRFEAGIPVMTVGALLGPDHANTVLAAGRSDLAVMARPHLRNPYLTLHAAEHYGWYGIRWPGQYRPGAPSPPKDPVRRALRPMAGMRCANERPWGRREPGRGRPG